MDAQTDQELVTSARSQAAARKPRWQSWLIMRSGWHELAALGLLVVAASLFHWRGLAPGAVFIAVDKAHNQLPWILEGRRAVHNWLLSDPIWQSYPFIAHALGPGGNSLWNPDIFLGHPRFADPLAQPYYPVFRILGHLFGAARGFSLSLWLHLLWAAFCMYGFLRTAEHSRRAAVFGALTYTLSGYLVTWFEYTHRIGTLAWLPAVLWTYELAVKHRDWRYAALSAVCLGVAVLNGQLQFIGAFVVMLGLYALGHALGMFYATDGRRTLLPVLQFAFIAAAGVALGSVLLLPFAAYLDETNRAGATGIDQGLPMYQLLTLLVPDFFGNPTVSETYRGFFNYNEDTIYAGVVALLLAISAPFQTRRRATWYLLAITLIVVYIVVEGPGVRAVGSLPFLAYLSLRRSAFLLPLLLAMLAAHWLDSRNTSLGAVVGVAAVSAAVVICVVLADLADVQATMSIVRPAIITSLLLMLATLLLAVARRRWPEHVVYVDWAIVGLLFVDLALWGSRYNPVGKVADLYPVTPGIRQLQEIAPRGRVAALQTADEPLFGMNTLPLFGLSEPGGYSSIVPDRLTRLIEAGDPKVEAIGIGEPLSSNGNIVFFNRPSMRLLDLLHVSHLVSPESLPLGNEGMEYEGISCTTESAEISGSTVITGTFPVADTAINRLDVQLLRDRASEPQGDLVVRMWRLGDERTLMFEEQFDPTQIADREPITFYFAPETAAPGHRYEVAVLAAEGAETGTKICMDGNGNPSLAAAGVDWFEMPTDEFSIYERSAPLSRAFVAYDTESVATDADAISTLLDETFDVRNVAVLLAAEAPSASLEHVGSDYAVATPAQVTEEAPNRMVVRARAHRPGVLVVSERFHGGWRATIDGLPADVFPVDYVYRGVLLEPGDHEIIFTFRPRSLRIGAAFTLGALLICLVVFGWAFYSHRAGEVGGQ